MSDFSSSDVIPASLSSCVRHCLRHTARIFVFIVIISVVVHAIPHFLSEEESDDTSIELPDKRLARLSYFRSPYGGSSRRRYDSYGYNSYDGGYGKYGKKAVNRHRRFQGTSSRYNMPWENLPNTNCLRKFCRSDDDCCRRYSKCNEEARVCYDCWYGHPCSSNRDCCEKFPYCNSVLNTCSK
ncbi:unnamed protein product [Lymnaea stagnalis]|uniref:Uncharacterized protein n=1 Tax=Lymnaea stagnalis TaxID=6523 RepID=A0AAV2IK26_LYMST